MKAPLSPASIASSKAPSSAKEPQVSAFDLGQRAGSATDPAANPFEAGSDRHNNFEVGRRFGAENARRQKVDARAKGLDRPDADERGFDDKLGFDEGS